MVCSKCNIDKPEYCFYKHPSIKPNGIRKKCNDCRNLYRKQAHKKDPKIKRRQSKNWTTKNKDKVNERAREKRKNNPERYKGYCLRIAFGIEYSDFAAMLKAQNGVCYLCKKPETALHNNGKVKNLAVDHCAKTGKIRKLLCWKCNTGIGKLNHDPELMRLAALYIEEHN